MIEPDDNGERRAYERRRDKTVVAIGATGLFLLGLAGVFIREVGSSPLLLTLAAGFLSMVVGPIVLPKKGG